MKTNVVIIGAGPAGLTAAYELLKSSCNYHIVILEEDCQVGGISKTINYKGNRMDLGGHRFFSKSNEVIKLWNEVLPLQGKPSIDDKILNKNKKFDGKGPDPDKDDLVMLKRDRVSRIFYKNKFFNYPVTMNYDTFKKMGFLETFLCGCSYLKSLIFKRKELSLEDFYINRFGKRLYSIFFEGYTEKLWGRHPREISSAWGSQRVKGLSIMTFIKQLFNIKSSVVETSLIEEFMYPKYGPGQYWELLANRIFNMGGEIRLNSCVKNILVENGNVSSVIYEDGTETKKIDCDILISSMPLKDLVNGMNDVPKKIRDIALGLPYRDFITVGLLVKKLKIKNETKFKTICDNIPDCWLYIQDKNVKLGRIQIFNNWSPYMVLKPYDTVWIGLEFFCNENDKFWNLSDKKRVALATNELINMGIIESNDDVLDYHNVKVKKAYPAYFDTYKDINKLINYLNKIDNLYCIGRNGQHKYNNMDHSMLTGMEAANNIIYRVKSKKKIWKINTEGEYHETKK